ncbi:MAG TPA: aminoacyl-tRNA hydrolase [Verrucomicrobiae bacterium]|nr:aminoacyl-tRNA hydrolase [Verrucomicrobiae bacterium]
MENVYLIAGLGNPGVEYERTRHNAGFLLADFLARRWRANWAMESKFAARVARLERDGRRLVLCQPQTYMNASGEAVGKLAHFFRVPLERLLVVVDDADLPFGTIRLRPDGSSGGHHGLESIQQHVGSSGYPRLRIGIGRTRSDVREITGHVLGRFSNAEGGWLEQVLERAGRQVERWLEAGVQRAMNEFNGAVPAPGNEEKQ